MPILVGLDDVLYARRMSLTELSRIVGITLANLSILKTGKARAIRFSTLEAICSALDCQPGDLLAYVPRAEADGDGPADPSTSGRTPEPGREPHEGALP
jgi:putative transcriptional regulator